MLHGDRSDALQRTVQIAALPLRTRFLERDLTGGDRLLGLPQLPGSSPRQALPPALLRQLEALGLSAREFDVVGLSAQDLTHDDIAQRLEITAATVNSHWRNIAAKLGVSPKQAQDWLREEINEITAGDAQGRALPVSS